VKEADGKAKRKRGKRKRGRGGQGAKSGPDQQQAAPIAVQGRPSGAPRGNEQIQFSRNDNRSNLSRGELKWTTNGLPPTEPDLHAGTNPLYKRPGAVRLGGTPDGPLNVLWTIVGDVSVRHPPLIVAPALMTLSFWALLPPPLNSSRSGLYIRDKNNANTAVFEQLFVSLHRWSVACACHSPSVLWRWTDPLVAKPHCYRKAGPSLVTCPRIRSPQRL
jgi:hypothetical protein